MRARCKNHGRDLSLERLVDVEHEFIYAGCLVEIVSHHQDQFHEDRVMFCVVRNLGQLHERLPIVDHEHLHLPLLRAGAPLSDPLRFCGDSADVHLQDALRFLEHRARIRCGYDNFLLE